MQCREAVVEGTQTRILRSELAGKQYLISVGLPYGYHEEPDMNWPVAYHIDGNVYFGLVTEIVRSMAWCGPTSDAVVVGIGYASEAQLGDAWDDRLAWRYEDLTPVRDEEADRARRERTGREVKSGGSGEFLAFLEAEVIGFVESSYRIDKSN